MRNRKIALEPKQFPAYLDAITSSGGEVVPLESDVTALVWTDYSRPDLLATVLEENPQLSWVQLPFAGVDAFEAILKCDVVFTSAKRSYSEPVAEHALMLMMASGRILKTRSLAKTWGKKHAESLYDAKVVIVGGGGIAQELVKQLAVFRSEVVIVRKRVNQPFDHSRFSRTVGFDALDQELTDAKFVVLACALTSETRLLFNDDRFGFLPKGAYLVNVSRGEVVDQEALHRALSQSRLAGAAIDVTYPEPLPKGHPLWELENLIITPHTADTMQIVTELFARRLRENVSAWLAGTPMVGVVDKDLGY